MQIGTLVRVNSYVRRLRRCLLFLGASEDLAKCQRQVKQSEMRICFKVRGKDVGLCKLNCVIVNIP